MMRFRQCWEGEYKYTYYYFYTCNYMKEKWKKKKLLQLHGFM